MPIKNQNIATAVTLILLILVVVLSATSFFYFRNRTLNYSISLPTVAEPDHVAFTYGEQPALSNPDFFGKVKQKFIDNRGDFIEADLSGLMLRVYKEGELTLQVPINTKGRDGSWWETPAGLYKVISKEKAHFSSIGHVWMPWSLNFQGNFFIHGRTYYSDGSLTSAAYTGGCIRLSTEDAEKVYNSVEVGTPILVFEHSFSPDNFVYENKVGLPISAPIYLSADLLNNHVFESKSATLEVPIASITKLMTALITTEYINLDNSATVPQEALVYTSKPRLKVGEQYTVYQLLFPMLLESSNEAAETIARHFGRSVFIKRMNEKAASIGMTHTKFADPSGASAENVSTAEDLFMLAKYIYNNRSFIFNMTSGKLTTSAYGASQWSDLGNYNDFVGHPNFVGGKNGKTTAAFETNLSVFNLPVGETKRPIVTIILSSPDEKADGKMLLEYTLNHFR